MKGFAKSKRKIAKPSQLDLFGDPIEEPRRVQAGQGIIPLDFESHAVRMILINGFAWWVLSDVARVLGYRDAEVAGRLLRDKQKGTPLSGTPGIQPHQTLVNESGLYRLMMRSDKPEAERFQDWITEEVLPSIRRTGSYSIPGPSDRVRRTMKQIRCDEETAVRRLENRDLNKRLHDQMFASGMGIHHIAEMHNAVYRGQTGKEAKALREMAGIKPDATPLDRMSGLALAENTHAKTLADRIIREQGIEPKARASIYELTASQLVAHDIAKLDTSLVFAAVDDPQRGKVIDLIPALVTPPSSPESPPSTT